MGIEVVSSLDVLFPPFREQAEKFLKLVEPIDFYIYETYRSFEKQMEYYKLGRELQNGVWVVTDKNAVRTNAKPGMSFHAYGLAFDAVADGDQTKGGVQWDWGDTYKAKDGTIQKIQWIKMGSLGKSIGLEWAGDWKTFTELPHSQNRFGFKVSELYPILVNEGLETVWKKLYTKVPPSKNMVTIPNMIPMPAAVVVKPEPIPVAAVTDLDAHIDSNGSVATSSGIIDLIGDIIKAILSAFAGK